METITREYLRLRRAGWQAQNAFEHAKTLAEFKRLEYEDKVRLRIEPDESADIEDLKGDTFNPQVNTDIPLERLQREEKEFEEKVNQEGVYGIIGEYFDGEKWQHADSCWGFVGDDWKDSGYDSDIMSSTIQALKAVTVCPTCGRPNK